MSKKIEVEFTLKQNLAFGYLNDDITTEVLFGGSAGGGKSFLGCAWLIINSIRYPGTRWLMGRSKLKALKQTTLQTFFEVCSMWGLTSDHYIYNAQSGEIKFYNDSVIILKDLFTYPSDPNFDSLGSMEITGAFIDEVNQISEKAKNIVASRMRYKLDDYDIIPKLFMSCNPSKNWTYSEFYKKHSDGSIEDYKVFIPALLTDNPNISKHYIKQLEKLDDISKRRLLYGQWEYEDLDAIINYDSILNSFVDYRFDIDNVEADDYYISVDVARKGKDKAVIMTWYGFNIIDIITLDISLMDEIKAILENIKNRYKISNRSIVIDEDGIGGGLVDFMKGSKGFVNNSKALNGDNFQNLKTQCYFKLAENINDNNVNIFNNNVIIKEKITQELASVKRKNMDRDGKFQIIGKDEVKALIGRSPDYSDAMMMRMYFELKNVKFYNQIIADIKPVNIPMFNR